MNSDRSKLAETLFQDAADLPADVRSAFLDEKCGHDGELRREVEDLLKHLNAAGKSFLQQPDWVSPAGSLIAQPTEQVGIPDRIGRYRIIRAIGEGGMGTVYEAEQDHPRRRVALKVIRSGMVSPALLRRFEHEANILGQLKHAGIAQIYEAGMADVGGRTQPFFAMEFVEGRPLLDHVQRQQPTVPQRLELMAKICDAVQHAHQKGIIHRDLKPGNILVEDQEITPRRHDDTKREESTFRTSAPVFDGVAGASPKILDFGVARAIHSDIQVATMQTEVGQLIGTLSYMSPEQIAARPDELDTRSDVYALGVILYELLAGKLPYELRDRSIPDAGRVIREQEPTRLSSVDAKLRGDVETIVAKALEKDKTRRYQSAADLASDIRRFLNDEPIVARPASAMYQLRKFAKRNKAFVGGLISVFAVLLIGLVGISLALVRAKKAEGEASMRLAESLREQSKAAAVNQFLQQMLESADPGQAQGREVTVREMVDQAAEKLNDRSLAAQPEIDAEVRMTIANVYTSLGLFDKAEEQYRAALAIRRSIVGIDQKEIGQSLRDLASLLNYRSRYAEASEIITNALVILRRYAASAPAELGSALQIQGATLRGLSDFSSAEQAYREALELRMKAHGEQSGEVAQTLNSIALLRQNLGDFGEAERLFRRALDIRRAAHGSAHPVVADSINNLAYVVQSRGELIESRALYNEALTMRRQLFGEVHPAVAQALNNLGLANQFGENLDEAEKLFRSAIDVWRSVHGESHPDIAMGLSNLGMLRLERGDVAGAEDFVRQSLTMRREALPAQSPAIASSLASLGQILIAMDRAPEAEALLSEALAIRVAKFPPEHWIIANTKSILGEAAMVQGRMEEAEKLLLEGYRGLQGKLEVGPQRMRAAVQRCAKYFALTEDAAKQVEFKRLLDQFPAPPPSD